MSDRSTINDGLPLDYLHENVISLFAVARESSFSLYLSPVVVFLLPYSHHPRKFIMENAVEVISLGTGAKFDLYAVQRGS